MMESIYREDCSEKSFFGRFEKKKKRTQCSNFTFENSYLKGLLFTYQFKIVIFVSKFGLLMLNF